MVTRGGESSIPPTLQAAVGGSQPSLSDGIPESGLGEVVEVTDGYREIFEGETVDFDCDTPSQDGYDFRATNARPRGPQAPHRVIRRYRAGEHPHPSAGIEIQISPTQQFD
jgi:hypothetical protein